MEARQAFDVDLQAITDAYQWDEDFNPKPASTYNFTGHMNKIPQVYWLKAAADKGLSLSQYFKVMKDGSYTIPGSSGALTRTALGQSAQRMFEKSGDSPPGIPPKFFKQPAQQAVVIDQIDEDLDNSSVPSSFGVQNSENLMPLVQQQAAQVASQQQQSQPQQQQQQQQNIPSSAANVMNAWVGQLQALEALFKSTPKLLQFMQQATPILANAFAMRGSTPDAFSAMKQYFNGLKSYVGSDNAFSIMNILSKGSPEVKKIIPTGRTLQKALEKLSGTRNGSGMENMLQLLSSGVRTITNDPIKRYGGLAQNLSNAQAIVKDPTSILAKMTNINDGYLTAFPQWLMKQAKKTAKQATDAVNAYSMGNRLTNATDPQFQRMKQISGNLKQIAFTDGRWQGSLISKLDQKTGKALNRSIARSAASQRLLNKALTQQQVLKEVPSFVKDIVSANSTLSSVGFGPISQNSSDLYAGRWLDGTTGHMRVLPTANSKYINPTVKEQKLGYLQAKILNHWNNCISSYDQYQRAQRSNTDLFEQTAKKIENGINSADLDLYFAAFIIKKIQTYMLDPMKPTASYAIMRGMDVQNIYQSPDALLIFPNHDTTITASTKQDQEKSAAAAALIMDWNTAADRSTEKIRANIKNAADLDDIAKNQLQVKLNQAFLGLVSYKARKIRGAMRSMLQMAIPTSLTAKNITTAVQNAQKYTQQFKKLRSFAGENLDQNTVNSLQNVTKSLVDSLRQGKVDPKASVQALRGSINLLRPSLFNNVSLQAAKRPSLKLLTQGVFS